MSRFKQYITEGKKITNPMIGFGVRQSDIQDVVKYLESELIQENIRFQKTDDYHISISQILGTYDKDELVRVTHDIGKDITLRPKGIKILRGKRVPKDFIVIEYHPAKEFVDDVEKLSDSFDTMKFSKVLPHMSLFTVKRGTISDELMKSLNDSAPKLKKIKPTEIQLWNAKHEKEYTK